jgi:hypothetical protein
MLVMEGAKQCCGELGEPGGRVHEASLTAYDCGGYKREQQARFFRDASRGKLFVALLINIWRRVWE